MITASAMLTVLPSGQTLHIPIVLSGACPVGQGGKPVGLLGGSGLGNPGSSMSPMVGAVDWKPNALSISISFFHGHGPVGPS